MVVFLDSVSERTFFGDRLATEIRAGAVRTEHLCINAFEAEGKQEKDHMVVR